VVSKNAVDQGLTIPLYHGHGISNDTFLQLAGPAAQGVRLAGSKLLVASELPDSDPMKPGLLKYAEQYTAKYNAPISAFGGHAFDAFQIVAQALGRSGADPARLREEIEKTKKFVGVGGIFNYTPEDHHGMDERSLALIEVRDGKWTLAK
jgi:branched-chain amino acid transport system substrate-binding protein